MTVLIILSGFQFVRLQRLLREDWQPRLYRFLPDADYQRMVTRPATQVERSYYWVAIGSGLTIVALTVIVVLNAISSGESGATILGDVQTAKPSVASPESSIRQAPAPQKNGTKGSLANPAQSNHLNVVPAVP